MTSDERLAAYLHKYDAEEQERIVEAVAGVRAVLQLVDKNANRDGLQDTPLRYVKFLREFVAPAEFELREFDGEQYGGMVVQSNIPFYSLCEHHLAPFHGTATIAYIPDGRIVGLSKLARVLDKFARQLQNQERITNQVAVYLEEHLKPKGVAVVITAQHLCMSMRGAQKHDTWTTTAELLGAFKEQAVRNELYDIIKISKP